MQPVKYYQRNALLHGEVQTRSGQENDRLSKNPSEVDIALFWLNRLGVQGSILDVGCGTLNLLTGANKLFQRRVGVDIAEHPNWKKCPEIEKYVLDIDELNLQFSDDCFDAVTCLMTIEHIFDPFHVVREIRRVCKEQGVVIVAVPNIAGIKRRLELLLGKLPISSTRDSFAENAWDGFHLHNFTKKSFEWLLRKEGLVPIKWASQGKLQFLKKLRVSLFGNDLIALCKKESPQQNLPASF